MIWICCYLACEADEHECSKRHSGCAPSELPDCPLFTVGKVGQVCNGEEREHQLDAKEPGNDQARCEG